MCESVLQREWAGASPGRGGKKVLERGDVPSPVLAPPRTSCVLGGGVTETLMAFVPLTK